MNTIKSRKINRNRLKSEVLNEVRGALHLLGEIITWSPGEAEHTHAEVRKALQDESLDETVAGELLPRYAFARACKHLEQERLIDVLKEETDVITFQFTKKLMNAHSDEWLYKKETLLKLNKITGIIECPIKDLEKTAQKLIDKHIEVRTTSDVTKIVQRLFEREADLFPIRDQGGAYFVPQEYIHFVAKIEGFLSRLGGHVNRFAVPKGSPSTNKSVQTTLAMSLDQLIADHKAAVDSFGNDTSAAALQRTAEKIKHTRTKIEAYAEYLMERKEDMLAAITEANDFLAKRVEQITKAQKNNPVPTGRVTINGTSNKEIVFHLWKDNKSLSVDKAHAAVHGNVERNTIKGWLGQWSKGNNLPACARKD